VVSVTDRDARLQGNVTHERTVESAYSHMDLSEHVTWMLSEAVDGVDYPQRVSVEITVERTTSSSRRCCGRGSATRAHARTQSSSSDRGPRDA
jgi:hypothetical protein